MSFIRAQMHVVNETKKAQKRVSVVTAQFAVQSMRNYSRKIGVSKGAYYALGMMLMEHLCEDGALEYHFTDIMNALKKRTEGASDAHSDDNDMCNHIESDEDCASDDNYNAHNLHTNSALSDNLDNIPPGDVM